MATVAASQEVVQNVAQPCAARASFLMATCRAVSKVCKDGKSTERGGVCLRNAR